MGVYNVITKFLIREDVIAEEDAEIYIFGLKQLVMYVINIATMIVIGMITNTLIQLVVFTIGYMFYYSDVE